MRETGPSGIALVKAFEGLADGDPTTANLDPYLDPVDIWTIGWGHAIRTRDGYLWGQRDEARARALYPGGITMDQAEALLRADLLDACRDVNALVKVPLNDHEFDALVSFEFN